MKKYVVAMDNLFTYSRSLIGARERHVAVVGTARAQGGWPPKEYRDVEEERFNSLHVDNFQINRWVDNNIVTMVTTMHELDETTVCVRKKPQVTTVNKKNLSQTWDDSATKAIEIPQCVDNYNHWMGGVDVADQLVSN